MIIENLLNNYFNCIHYIIQKFDLQSQKTIDAILDLILYKYKYFITPIKTEKLDFKESAIKMRREAEINQLEKEIKKAKELLEAKRKSINRNNEELRKIEELKRIQNSKIESCRREIRREMNHRRNSSDDFCFIY